VAESRLAVVAALLGNLLIAILKLVAGLASQSAAMFAEAAHSFSDVGNQILLLLGIARAHRPPSPEHPFGTGKAAYFWPFMVAILLFGVAGAYSAFEGIEKFQHPHAIGDIRLSLAVLAAAFAIEAVSLFIAFREAKKGARRRGIANLRQFLDENRDATLITVLVEDGLALVGLPIAALALVLAQATGDPRWDAAGSLTIGLLLMGIALFLGSVVQRLLIGAGLSRRDLERVTAIIAADPATVRIAGLQSMYLGPDVVLLGAEVELRESGPGQMLAATARIETALVQALPQLKFVYVEPQGPSTQAIVPAAKTAHAPN
jgi:cation diffusion facilitator family transporter